MQTETLKKNYLTFAISIAQRVDTLNSTELLDMKACILLLVYVLYSSAVVRPVDLFVAEAECLISNQLLGPRL